MRAQTILFLLVDRVREKLNCRPYRGGGEGNPKRLVEAASLAFSNRSNILTIRHSGPARISSSKILPCVSSCSLFTPSALAGDSLRHTSCSGSYCESAGLDGKNLSSR